MVEKVTHEDYYNIFVQNPTGAKILKDMMHAHRFYGTTFSTNDLEMALNEGERNAVLRILTILKQYEEEKKHG